MGCLFCDARKIRNYFGLYLQNHCLISLQRDLIFLRFELRQVVQQHFFEAFRERQGLRLRLVVADYEQCLVG